MSRKTKKKMPFSGVTKYTAPPNKKRKKKRKLNVIGYTVGPLG